MDLLNNASIDYFYGRISIINDFDSDLSARLSKFIEKALSKQSETNYAKIQKIVKNDTANNASVTFKIKGQAEWALTDHVSEVFLYGLSEKEREEFCELLLNNPNSIFIDLNEYEPERLMLHEITGYLGAYADRDTTLYIRNYYYDEIDFTAYNITRLGFEDGVYENSRDFLELAKDLAMSKPICELWKKRYHKDRIDMLFGLRALIRGKDHQGVILKHELTDTKYLLAKMNKALIKKHLN